MENVCDSFCYKNAIAIAKVIIAFATESGWKLESSKNIRDNWGGLLKKVDVLQDILLHIWNLHLKLYITHSLFLLLLSISLTCDLV